MDQGKSRLKSQADAMALTEQCRACEEHRVKLRGKVFFLCMAMSVCCARVPLKLLAGLLGRWSRLIKT